MVKPITTVMILGGAGFLGANLAYQLTAKGIRVIVLDRPGSDMSRLLGIPENLINLRTFDLANIMALIALFEEEDISTVFHLVSGILPSSNFNQYQQELSSVLYPTFELINVCAKRGIKFIFFSSGGAIYGNAYEEKLSETHTLLPISYYGMSKVQIEEYIKFEYRKNKLDYLIVRPSNPYGRFQRSDGNQGIVAVAYRKLIRGERIEIWGDGSIVRDYIEVEDLMKAVDLLLDYKVINTTVNIGSGTGTSVIEIIRMLEKYSGMTANVHFLPARDADVKSVVLDVTRLQSYIPFSPLRLDEGIQKFCASCKNGKIGIGMK